MQHCKIVDCATDTEAMDVVLREFEPSLREIFKVYAALDDSNPNKALNSKTRLGYDEWQEFVKHSCGCATMH